MSREATDASGLGESYSTVNVDGTPTTVYHRDAEMDDTASSSVRLVREVVDESVMSSLGLTP